MNLNRMSERSGEDARMCEIVVDNVEKKDLGEWRSNLLPHTTGTSSKTYLFLCPGVKIHTGAWSDAPAAALQKELF